MEILVRSHSGLRWIALGLMIYAIFNALRKKDLYAKSDRMLNMFAMVSLHIQLVIGLILYFTSSKVSFVDGWMGNKLLRFYGMEHISLMILAIVLVTIGHAKAKRASEPSKKHKTIVLFYAIGLILIIASIPWPFRQLGAGWY
ncbi:MAG: cytochrome B [Bacteroidetes bacterium]|nr:cytochrome B [Bacteroidota bacterium]